MHELITHIFWHQLALKLTMNIEDCQSHIISIDYLLDTGKRTPENYSDQILESVKFYRKFMPVLKND